MNISCFEIIKAVTANYRIAQLLVMESRGQYLLSARVLEVRDVEIPSPNPDEVQIAPRSTTLCGSDLHYYNHGRNGSITIKEPLCLGHEFSGQVMAVGSAVTSLKPGDKVA